MNTEIKETTHHNPHTHNKGQASPARTSSIPPITNRGCTGNDVGDTGDKTPALKLCIDDRDPNPRSPPMLISGIGASAGAGAGSTGLGSNNSTPFLSTASSSHRVRSSLSARSIFDGRRRSKNSSDEDGRRSALRWWFRLRREEAWLWLRLRLRSFSSVPVVVIKEVSILLSLAGNQAGRQSRLNGDVGEDAGLVVVELSGLTVEQSLRA